MVRGSGRVKIRGSAPHVAEISTLNPGTAPLSWPAPGSGRRPTREHALRRPSTTSAISTVQGRGWRAFARHDDGGRIDDGRSIYPLCSRRSFHTAWDAGHRKRPAAAGGPDQPNHDGKHSL